MNTTVLPNSEDPGELMFFCPACKCGHTYLVEGKTVRKDGPRWQWNGNTEKPTFTPSLLITSEYHDHGAVTEEMWGPWTDHPTVKGCRERNVLPQFKHLVRHVKKVCHLYVTDGKIRYMGDCTHKLANQTVDMIAWDAEKKFL